MNRYLVDNIKQKYYRCKANEMIMVAIVGNIDGEYFRECIIFSCEDDFEKYLQEQLEDKSSIYTRICKKYYDYITHDVDIPINWQTYFLHTSKNILDMFRNLYEGNRLLISYTYLYNSDLIYEKIIGSNMKINKNIAIFGDTRGSKYVFYDDESEISQFIKKWLEKYIEKYEENIFSANLFRKWRGSSRYDFVKQKLKQKPNKDWYNYYHKNCGGIIMNVIPTDDIKFYKKIDRIISRN
jgi:hypothetical protein